MQREKGKEKELRSTLEVTMLSVALKYQPMTRKRSVNEREVLLKRGKSLLSS